MSTYKLSKNPSRSGRRKNQPTYFTFKKQFRGILSPKGFVLPTMTMVLLVFSLVVGSILLRTSQYTTDVIANRESEVIYNSATPAIERAKTKIEYLFKRDPSFPNTVPSAKFLQNLMLPNEDEDNIYTLPDETRIDINGDGNRDNAWSYKTDLDGDGTDEVVAYSIIINNKTDDGTVDLESSDEEKARKLLTRTGPLSIQGKNNSGECDLPSLVPEEGWYSINQASLRKNFQVDAVVVNPKDTNKAIATLEFQQDRQLDRGNKWGVWFRYDLELYPGPNFSWNGSMYTGGNIIWGHNKDETRFHNYLISSPNSCFYTEDASEIAVAQVEEEGVVRFQGQVINGAPAPEGSADYFAGSSLIDIYPGSGEAPTDTDNEADYYKQELNKESDSVDDDLETGSAYDFSLDPLVLFTEDKSESRYAADPSNQSIRSADWAESQLAKRMINKWAKTPYVDDFYRADNRWGPKPKDGIGAPQFGQLTTEATQITKDPASGIAEDVGLDGYWERRARYQGLRVIVGQRLELGNRFGWGGNNDPLYPQSNSYVETNVNRNNLARQRRTLRDNLAAVQATLIYHSAHNKDFPVATLATTVHNGTSELRNNSTTFSNLTIGGVSRVKTDFLTGEGTNGWEFNPPGNVTTQADFKAKIDQTSDPLRKALSNLAHFAGDPDGAFPPKQELSTSTDKIVHPYPYLTMWGDFSNLRRVIALLDEGTDYDALSIADQTTLQTASATLGLLAYNLKNAKEGVGMEEEYKQIERDRTLGFRNGTSPSCTSDCPDKPKYPSLYYIFPVSNHDQVTDQPNTEEYIRDSYIQSKNTNPTDPNIYKQIEIDDIVDDIALQPRAQADWVLPTFPTDTSTGNKITFNNGDGTTTTYYTAFLDKAFYDGRQLMQVRVLDLDLKLLKEESDEIGGQSWLSDSGIVYAFREDAVREDGIARPASSTWDNCKTETDLLSATCRMNTNVNNPKDPPINPETGISPKPIDFYPDPDRRPYGFRLKNGADLSRSGTTKGLSFISDNPIYLQGDFNLHRYSDDSVEEFTDTLNISNDSSDTIDAYDTTNWDNFYDRSDLNTNFARVNDDTWRPSEILGDAVSILSNSFCDGTFEDGMRNNNDSCPAGNSSYRNSVLARAGNNFWVRENSQDLPDSLNSSIRVNRNNIIQRVDTSVTPNTSSNFNNYRAIYDEDREKPPDDSRELNKADVDTEVNLVLISGLVPSRKDQSYGGLHNFPRFLQNWNVNSNQKNILSMKGSFFQLNFSTYATAPYDQDAWEPGQTIPDNAVANEFFGAPQRQWGYDVALQYTPPSPVVDRFVEVSNLRNEFYQRVAADDPYIMLLRCASVDKDGDGDEELIDDHLDSEQCPSNE
ncbi:hormogonium polysaccharide biosynthesis protein HpsA [Gloeothece citriformis]|uniref:hormogonium polysaccharide biosynthesis protein HpsA n=1 Tax=Gloeothece citriformis TaxID=2546356 RepID=UPI0012FF0398|nr:hormogonium polysaccharide biosynthesis protein HpsA [Gloeothece citriformis]